MIIADDATNVLIHTVMIHAGLAGNTRRCPYCGNPATQPVATIPLLLAPTPLHFTVEVRRCSDPGCGLMWLRTYDSALVATPLHQHHHRPVPPTTTLQGEPTHCR
jgi:hypothetical protein